MKCTFVYNPNSGKGKIAKKLPYIKRRLEEKFDEVEIFATKSAEHLRTLARESDCDVLLFSGGDGTFNDILQGTSGRDIQLGYLPAGTTNDVARSLSIPRSVRGALDVVLGGRSERLDCLRAGDRYVMYVAAAGAFTDATYRTPQKKKRMWGRFAYALEGIRHDLHFPIFPLTVECDEGRFEGHSILVLVLNGRSVAGLPINRRASMQDGVLEVAVIRQREHPGFWGTLRAYFAVIAMFLFGVRVKRKDIAFLRGERVRIGTGKETVWDFDGEKGTQGDLELEILPKYVKLFVPQKAKI